MIDILLDYGWILILVMVSELFHPWCVLGIIGSIVTFIHYGKPDECCNND